MTSDQPTPASPSTSLEKRWSKETLSTDQRAAYITVQSQARRITLLLVGSIGAVLGALIAIGIAASVFVFALKVANISASTFILDLKNTPPAIRSVLFVFMTVMLALFGATVSSVAGRAARRQIIARWEHESYRA